MSEWISVEDRLPEPEKKVLVYSKNGDWYGVYWRLLKTNDDREDMIDWWWQNDNDDFWTPHDNAIYAWTEYAPCLLPEPPETDDE